MSVRNETRAAWAETALESYLHSKMEVPDAGRGREDIVDLATDLIHLAHQRKIKVPASILESAMVNFIAEKSGRA